MCNSANCKDPFHGLDDEFLDDFNMESRDAEPKPVIEQAEKPVFEEPCTKCRGTGWFYGYSGRAVGKCFTCKGTGKLTFKQSPDERIKQAERRLASKKEKAAEVGAKMLEWMETHAAEWKWLMDRMGKFDFAGQMVVALGKYGYLTENQMAAVQRCMAKDALREERIAAEKLERETNAKAVNVQPIIDAFEIALGNSIKSPKLRLGEFRFSLAPSHGANAGAIYVKTNDDARTYLGKIVEGKFLRGRDCSPEQEAGIVAVCANPAEEAVAYGRRTGSCAICGRELTNHESIDRGIGPICADNYGF